MTKLLVLLLLDLLLVVMLRKIIIKIKNNIIVDSKFKTFGCGSAIASVVLLLNL